MHISTTDTSTNGDPALYATLVKQYTNELSRLKKILFYTAVGRLAAFVAMSYGMYQAFAANSYWALLALVALTVFLWLVKQSAQLVQQRTLTENLLFINQNEVHIANGNSNGFDDGEIQANKRSYFDDLDIFGRGSLFQLLNRCGSIVGRDSLANYLKEPLMQVETISEQQQAIQVLTPQNQQRQHIIAHALFLKDQATVNIASLQQWASQPARFVHNKWINIIRFLLPVVNLVGVAIYLYYDVQLILACTVVLSWLQVLAVASSVKEQGTLLGKKQEMLLAYAGVLNGLTQVNAGQSVLLQHMQQKTLQANKGLKKLGNLVNLLDQRLNVFVNILLNSIFLYDVHCIIALEKWKEENRDELAQWIYTAGKLEALVSFATYAFNHPENNYPTFSTVACIEAKLLYNPLIKPNTSVSNHLNIGQQYRVVLITGSNMSGKTTWLRTVGTNVLMAQCGLPVCAESFHFSPLYIFSSIRVSDSLQEQTSYFMAELKRLHTIIENLQTKAPALVLIDEILRGTNSEDKYKGSYHFVQQLLKHNCLVLFATHDLALSKMEDDYPGAVANYCFESSIIDGELSFDYRMHAGVARNKNATFLMKKMGIIEAG